MKEFSSLTAFVEELIMQAKMVDAYAHRGLDEATKIIEECAKAEIGIYQDAVGEFNAWDELADSTKSDRVQQGYSENEPLLRSGELRDSISREVGTREAVVGSDSDIMVYQELGTPTIPPRPVIGPAALRTSARVQVVIGESVVEGLLYFAPGTLRKLSGAKE